MSRRIAVVLFNLGGPDRLSAVAPFLFNLFYDPAIISLPNPLRWIVAFLISRIRLSTAKAIYAHMGGASPLLSETRTQQAALSACLAAELPGDDVRVEIAMRYWHPFTSEAAKEIKAFGPDEVVLLPLYPQFSSTTTGSSMALWRQSYTGSGRLHAVCCYPERPGFIAAHVHAIRSVMREAADGGRGLRIIFSAHGLPEKIINGGDPYKHQIERSASALALAIEASDWRVSYQSRVGPMKWIGPSTLETLAQAGRDGVGVLVVPIAFVSEHSETLVELDRDYRDFALKAGVTRYLRAPAIGADVDYIKALAEMVLGALLREGPAPQSISCQERFSQCPFQNKSKAA